MKRKTRNKKWVGRLNWTHSEDHRCSLKCKNMREKGERDMRIRISREPFGGVLNHLFSSHLRGGGGGGGVKVGGVPLLFLLLFFPPSFRHYCFIKLCKIIVKDGRGWAWHKDSQFTQAAYIPNEPIGFKGVGEGLVANKTQAQGWFSECQPGFVVRWWKWEGGRAMVARTGCIKISSAALMFHVKWALGWGLEMTGVPFPKCCVDTMLFGPGHKTTEHITCVI